jgi:hypothetical protein
MVHGPRVQLLQKEHGEPIEMTGISVFHCSVEVAAGPLKYRHIDHQPSPQLLTPLFVSVLLTPVA